MSEVQSRPSAPRGRSSARGGRAAYGSRGGRGSRAHDANGTAQKSAPASNDSPEIIQMKKQYGGKVSTVKEMFPGWSDEDIVFALQETDGDLELTIEKIAEGSITQFGEVSNTKKERSKSKAAKDTVTSTLGDATNNARTGRGGRGSQESNRGGRGRASDRGGRGGRGRGAASTQTNGSVRSKETTELSVPTEDAWGTTKKEDATEPEETSKPADSWGAVASEAASSATAAVASAASTIIPDGAKKSWASMFKAAPAPPAEKKTAAVAKAPEPEPEPEPPTAYEAAETIVDILPPADANPAVLDQPTPVSAPIEEPVAALTPSKDELTETNLEQLPDTSQPAPTETAASTAASSWDPRQGASSGTPYSSLQPGSTVRPPASGYAASAQKATGTPGRIPSFQRRVLDQEEAVRMPGNREVDRTAVQFGAFNLGSEDDVDGEREEPETRAQPPQHSPVAHPRASLPPAPAQPAGLPAALPSPKDAPGLPAAPAAAPGLPSPQTQANSQGLAQQGSQSQYGQYGRYGQTAPEPSAFGGANKQYDPFSQQAPGSQSQYDGFQGQQGQSQSQQQSGAFSSAPSEYSNYYTADQGRGPYSGYYGQQYGQQQGGQSEPQQRSASGFNPSSTTENTAQYPQSSAAQAQSRYATAGETSNSGHTTPNPTAQGQQPNQPSQTHTGHQGQQHSGQPQYPYGHPYYGTPYYGAYMNQYQQSYGQGGYGQGGPYGKYSQHGYGASPAAPYDHAASPATGGFGQSSLGRDSSLGGGLGDYGRGASQQSSQGLGGSGAFGGMSDSFGRNSSYQGQGQQYGQQGSQSGAGDDLKPFSENKPANGPSPLLSQAARPGSAANSGPGQSSLPPPQSSQQGGGYGGYPSHLQQGLHSSQSGSQYGSLGGAGGHQSGSGHQSSQYGSYGSGGFGGNNYYGGGGQQRGGWGNNYNH